MNMVTVLMMTPKMVTLDLLRIKLFLNEGYDSIISPKKRHQQNFITGFKL